ncbi:hypothetical protein GCM10025762_39430 [Haloechinothrix salitolerans]
MPPAPTVAAPQRIEPQRQSRWGARSYTDGPSQEDTDPRWQSHPVHDFDAATDALPYPEHAPAGGAPNTAAAPHHADPSGTRDADDDRGSAVESPDHATDRATDPAGSTPDAAATVSAADVIGARRRGKKPLVITLVVLLLLGVVGGALVVPDVANRLALPWAPNAPQQPPPEPVAVSRSLMGPEEAVRAPTPAGVSAALEKAASSEALGTLSGSVVDPVTGTALWERDADKPLPPASTTKVLTAAAALLSIDHTATLTTRVVNGPDPGSVVLVAGGDPTLSSAGKGEDTLYTDAARLNDLVKQVRTSAGDVDTVYLDTSTYQGGRRAPGWEPGDAPSTYAAPIEPVMLDGGRTSLSNEDAPRTGDPAAALAAEFAKRLGASVGGSASASARDATVLGEVYSAPLTVLIADVLTASDNVLAEAVARQVALANDQPASFGGAATAIKRVLDDAGFDVSGVTLADGSGLSSKNAVPARLLTDIIAAAAGDPADPTTAKLRPLLTGLPVAGGTGTLIDRYGRESPGNGWVRAKTGTLSGVNTLAGVVLTKSGRLLVFSLMSSGTGPSSARPALDAVASALRGCGCR